MSYDEAVEWFCFNVEGACFNVEGAYVGEHGPVFISTDSDWPEDKCEERNSQINHTT